MSGDADRPGRRSAGRRMVQVGVVLFAVGIVVILITVVPFFTGAHNRPLWLNLLCLLAPLGFVLAVGGVVRGGRDEQREVTRRIR